MKRLEEMIEESGHPEIDEAARKVQRITLRQLGELGHMTREGARQYLGRQPDNLYLTWKMNQELAKRYAREQTQQEETRRRHLERQQKAHRLRQLMKTDWPLAKALEYHGRPNTRLPLDSLVALFRLHKAVEEEGRYIPYAELAQQSGIKTASTVHHIYKTVGFEPLRPGLTELQKEAAMRGFSYGFSAVDTAYFLRVFEYLTRRLHWTAGAPHARFGNLRFDSQVYALRHKRKSIDDIAETLNAEEHRVEVALKHKRRSEPRIIGGLRAIYKRDDIEKPYLTPDLRLHRP